MAVMLSTFMEVLDTTVVNVALPHIAGSVSATEDEATWALTSYLVANAIILPMAAGSLSTSGASACCWLPPSVSHSLRHCAASRRTCRF